MRSRGCLPGLFLLWENDPGFLEYSHDNTTARIISYWVGTELLNRNMRHDSRAYQGAQKYRLIELLAATGTRGNSVLSHFGQRFITR